MKTVVALYDDITDARDAVSDLVDSGFSRDDISFVAVDREGRYSDEIERRERDEGNQAGEGAAAGAVTGGIIGGVAGVLLGLGTFFIPGVGPLVAAGPIVAGLTGAGIGAVAGGIIGALIGWGIPEEHAEYYAEGVRRGGTLVAVKAPESRVDDAVDIVERHDPVDIERRAADWRAEGWTGFDKEAEPYTAKEMERERERYGRYGRGYREYEPVYRRHYESSYATTGHDYDYYSPGYRYGYTLAQEEPYTRYTTWTELEPHARRDWEHEESSWDEVKGAVRHAWNEARNGHETRREEHRTTRTPGAGDQTLDVVQEEMRVGKRDVERGGIRARTYVTEEPVEEDLELRQERVHVERRDVDRPASTSDVDAFEEQTIEMRERGEEAVVEKRARVIEEVIIGKDVDVEHEKVRDTVRRTHVDIDRVGSFEELDRDYRTHYDKSLADRGYTYEQYQPAYRYGYNLATSARYQDREWSEVEPEARRRWEDTNRGTWEEFKDAVRHGWQDVKRRM